MNAWIPLKKLIIHRNIATFQVKMCMYFTGKYTLCQTRVLTLNVRHKLVVLVDIAAEDDEVETFQQYRPLFKLLLSTTEEIQ